MDVVARREQGVEVSGPERAALDLEAWAAAGGAAIVLETAYSSQATFTYPDRNGLMAPVSGS